MAVGPDGQVQAVPRPWSRYPRAVLIRTPPGLLNGRGADPGGVRVVVVGAVGIPEIAAGLVEGRLRRVPGLGLEAVAHDGAVGAVEVV